MKCSPRVLLVLVTAPDLKVARKLARLALGAHLVACANLAPRLESHYWWQGQLERSAEVLLLLKTTTECVTALEKLVVAHHPYDTPEFIAVPLHGANLRYLKWWLALGRPAAAASRRSSSNRNASG